MRTIETKIAIGLSGPVRVLHLSDTHLTYADMRDGERKVLLREKRQRIFPHAEEMLTLAGDMAKEQGLTIIHTGDLIDFVSVQNLERVKEFTDAHDCFMAAGNHEFSLYVGEAKEDAAYRNQSLPAVQATFKNDIRMSSRMIGGVNFVALDNGYYLFEREQLEFLRREAEKDAPIVLLLHSPLYDPALHTRVMQKSPCSYLTGVPEELMQSYPPARLEQQRADEITLRVVRYIEEEPRIKAIIAGHLHWSSEGTVAGRIPQIVTGCTDIRLIEIV